MVHAIIQKTMYFEDSYALVPINYIKALVQSKFYDAHDYNMHRVSKYCICTNGVSIIYASMLSKDNGTNISPRIFENFTTL